MQQHFTGAVIFLLGNGDARFEGGCPAFTDEAGNANSINPIAQVQQQ